MHISDIRQCPQFADQVVDRIWRAWWRDKGVGVDVIAELVRQNLQSELALPLCLVAYDGDAFFGTVSLITSDVAARPALTPWVAALWVEPEARDRRIATLLLDAAVERARALGVPRLFLHCADRMVTFYEARGWSLFERDAPAPGMHILARNLA